MKHVKRAISILLAAVLCFFCVAWTGAADVMAEYTPTLSMLHTSGKYIYNEENEQITLRGTNLGGWLMQEGWMTPLGSGEIDLDFIIKIKPKSDYPLKTLYPRAFQTGQNHLIYYDFTTVE